MKGSTDPPGCIIILIVVEIVIAIAEVVVEAGVKQMDLRRNPGCVATQLREACGVEWCSIYPHAAPEWFVPAKQQTGQGRFPCARRANHSDMLSRRHTDVYILQDDV